MTGREMDFQDAVVDGFVGACRRVLRGPPHDTTADKRPILWLLLDHVLLLAQSPVHISASLVDTTGRIRRRFSSLSLQDRAFFGIPALAEDAFDCVVARTKAGDGTEVVLSLHELPGGGAFFVVGVRLGVPWAQAPSASSTSRASTCCLLSANSNGTTPAQTPRGRRRWCLRICGSVKPISSGAGWTRSSPRTVAAISFQDR